MIPLLPVLVRQYHASDVIGGALLSIPAFCSTIAAPVWGKLSDRLGRKTIIMASQVLSLAGYLLLALSNSLVLVLLSRVISGCGGGSLGAVESYIADVTTSEQRERAYALYGAVFGIAFVIGPVMSGALLRVGIALPFLVAAGLEGLNLIFTGLFVPRTTITGKTTSVHHTLRAAWNSRVRGVLVRQFLFIFAIVAYLANFGLYVDHVLRIDPSKASYLLAVAAIAGGATLVVVVTPLSRRIGEKLLLQIGLGIS
ncbi:MAG: MFS transporter, partial [Candidatus Eremiobacteraeota bacterium]|nr:MFS transporter [Candidatus Eremiobacteraeota bacterium]